MATRPLTGRDEARLKAMNKLLFPAHIRVKPSGAFMFDYRKAGKYVRRVVGYELEEAYEKSLLMRREMDDLPVVSNRRINLSQWYDEWSQKRYLQLSPTTVDQYCRCWRMLSADFKKIRIEHLTADLIRKELENIERDSMREHVAVFLSVLLKNAQKDGLLAESPWKASYSLQPKAFPIVPIAKLLEIIEAATPYVKPALALAAFCGLRRGEIMALTVGDIDIKSRRVYVTKARVRVFGSENNCDEDKRTKTNRDRFIPIPSISIPFLELALNGKGIKERIYPMFYGNVRKALKTACRRTNAPELTLHGLRHNCISHLVMKGDLKLAQMIAGHSRIQTTADRYTHLLPDYVQKQVEDVFTLPIKKQEDKTETGPDAEQICHPLSPYKKKGLTRVS